MSLSAVAAGSALAVYYFSRRGTTCDPSEPAETHRGVHSAPNTLLDDLYFLAEGLRCAGRRGARRQACLQASSASAALRCWPPLPAYCLLPINATPRTPALRYTYGETLGRWRTADLLIGLAYLCRKVGTPPAPTCLPLASRRPQPSC
jgi:hypothetical protein